MNPNGIELKKTRKKIDFKQIEKIMCMANTVGDKEEKSCERHIRS